jgi:hypothetical protein
MENGEVGVQDTYFQGVGWLNPAEVAEQDAKTSWPHAPTARSDQAP